MLGTSSECISILKLQIASEDAEIVHKVAQPDFFGGHSRMAEEKALLMSLTLHEQVRQLRTANWARCSGEVTLHSTDSQLQGICQSQSSLREVIA